LSSSQKVCLPFFCKDGTCTLGRACPNAHITPWFSLMPDLMILDGWVTRTTGAEWAAKLVAALQGSSQSSLGTQNNPPGNSAPASGANAKDAAATLGEG
jgi:hypothetical protein